MVPTCIRCPASSSPEPSSARWILSFMVSAAFRSALFHFLRYAVHINPYRREIFCNSSASALRISSSSNSIASKPETAPAYISSSNSWRRVSVSSCRFIFAPSFLKITFDAGAGCHSPAVCQKGLGAARIITISAGDGFALIHTKANLALGRCLQINIRIRDIIFYVAGNQDAVIIVILCA